MDGGFGRRMGRISEALRPCRAKIALRAGIILIGEQGDAFAALRPRQLDGGIQQLRLDTASSRLGGQSCL